jgi:cyclase
MSGVTIKTTQVAGNIYMLEGRGGNIGVSAGEDGVVLVDDQFAPLVPKILDAVKAIGKGEPKFVINTHWHPDHSGGNPLLGAKASIIAHENVRKRLSTRQEGAGRVFEPIPREGLPVVTYQESASLHMNGEEIKLIHFPRGHTDGDTVVFFSGANVVHMGDHFFSGRFPYVDTGSGGDPVQYAANVKSVLDQIKDDTKVIPGHGPLSSKADLAAFHQTLTETIQLVTAAKKAGKSLDQVVKAGLPEKYKAYGEGFIKTDAWIETIYKSAK